MKHIDTCHRRIEEALQALEALSTRLAAGAPCGAVECAAAAEVMACFEGTATEHHRDEEQALFPELRVRAAQAGCPEVGATLYELEMEHDRMHRLYEALRPGLAALASGGSAALDAGQVANFAWLYRRHMSLEARVIEPFVEQGEG